mmetsp:Transcript_42024/g.91563  ORF Transcript_42024/g.91563 Transcript_42024/m.91563 type:complete len:87 (-) Transcript_42024:467-727(-)
METLQPAGMGRKWASREPTEDCTGFYGARVPTALAIPTEFRFRAILTGETSSTDNGMSQRNRRGSAAPATLSRPSTPSKAASESQC